MQSLLREPLGAITVLFAANCLLEAAALGQTTPVGLSDDCPVYASIALPAESDKYAPPNTFPACASYRSYRGIGRPVNYAEARECAWQERLAQEADFGQNQEEPTAWVVGGSLILADIYFNGAGVKRDIPLALRFACEFDEGTASLALPEITKLNGSLPIHGPFEFCDYAGTTLTMGFCAEYASEIKDDRRSRYYSSLQSSMTFNQRAAFINLLAAEKAYIEAHASEVDQGGTIRSIRTLGSQAILEDLFHVEVVHFERKQWPTLSAHQIETAHATLEGEYAKKLQQLGAHPQEAVDGGAITASHLSRVQETWQSYRDAWVAFARLRYPAEVAVIEAQITLDRYRLLKTIL